VEDVVDGVVDCGVVDAALPDWLIVLGEEAVDWVSCDADALVSAPGSTREIFPLAIASALVSSVTTDSTD